ncbi:MAG TPA: inorganic phosphate transporter [Methanothermobacter sp.]|nr:inorganic phosphate transporter [Methanothermobacter sp.]HOK72347.1 inorganic phosphate transporter [Methanothermobacter sp.]HOL69762.1 inorganic phosphate transporter [Methanothermobacter sp.]HPQ05086.1 inorganic phosphate transporter [Methanothermobacter sp.]HPU37301.1 inorganic phosphate transporter [Methanothermobacter sp.]
MDSLLLLSVGLGLYFAFNIAANDIGNSIGTAVGSGALNMRRGLFIGAFFAFLGAVLFGGNVIKTVGDGIIPGASFSVVAAFAVILTAAIWITVTLLRRIPISGSDAMVSAVIGVGFVSVGWTGMNFNTVIYIILSWISSPIIGFFSGLLTYSIIRMFVIRRIKSVSLRDRLEKIFSYLQVFSSSFSAFNVGALDFGMAMGVLFILSKGDPSILRILGAFGLVLGIIFAGDRVTETIGRRITELVPTRGFSAQIAASIVIFVFVYYGMPISPTQTLVGSVIGVGLAHGTSSLKFDVIKDIGYTWILTIPACLVMSAMVYSILRILLGLL